MRTVTAHFDRYADAKQAVEELEKAGIPAKDISIISSNNEKVEVEGEHKTAKDAGAGAGIGAVAGGLGGLLAGLGLLAIPGVGPVVAAGWLAATAAGAVGGAAVGGAAGGLIGALQNAGIDEKDAHFAAEHIRRGGSLVAVNVDDDNAAEVDMILQNQKTVNVNDRRRHYEEHGWTRFDHTQAPYTTEQILAERKANPNIYNR